MWRKMSVGVPTPRDREDLSPHDPRHGEPLDAAEGDEEVEDAPPGDHHDQDDEEHEGQAVEHVDDSHHHAVDPPPDVARGRAVCHADYKAYERRHQPHGERHAGAVEQPRQQVAPQAVGAQPVAGARRMQRVGQIHRVEGERRQHRRQQRQHRQHAHEPGPHRRQAVGPQPPHRLPPGTRPLWRLLRSSLCRARRFHRLSSQDGTADERG